jgi:hypothetical protein
MEHQARLAEQLRVRLRVRVQGLCWRRAGVSHLTKYQRISGEVVVWRK